jgi:hypothetical protein
MTILGMVNTKVKKGMKLGEVVAEGWAGRQIEIGKRRVSLNEPR